MNVNDGDLQLYDLFEEEGFVLHLFDYFPLKN